MKQTTFADIYQTVTDSIIQQLEKGCVPWVKPWASNGTFHANPLNVISKKPYRGINRLILWSVSTVYPSAQYLTFKQALELGGNVRKGEHGIKVIYWDTFKRKETNAETGEEKEKSGMFCKAYTVFNVAQCENLPAKYSDIPTPLAPINTQERNAELDRQFDLVGISTAHHGDRAFYRPSTDSVTLPEFSMFKSSADYYATKAHEYTHATAHKSRVGRDLSGMFGNASYAKEELVAEIGAAFLCATLEIEGQLQHASYIESWLKVLKDDKRAIFKAASQAQKACDWLTEKMLAAPQAQAA